MDDQTRLQIAQQFIRDLINPEVYGLMVTDEIRVEALNTLRLISQGDK